MLEDTKHEGQELRQMLEETNCEVQTHKRLAADTSVCYESSSAGKEALLSVWKKYLAAMLSHWMDVSTATASPA